jgi:alpha-galactosidase
MKSIIQKYCFVLLSAFCIPAFAADYTQGDWKLSVNTNGTVSIYKSNKLLISNSQASFKIASTTYLQDQLSNVQVGEQSVSDNFGSGKCVTITSNTNDNHTVSHKYYLYNNYILTDLTISSDSQFESNYMAPVKSSASVSFLPSSNNKTLRVPFDNDKWIGYVANPFGSNTTSYEVTAIYNADSNEGLVIGSIDHTQWKTGVKVNTSSGNLITGLEVFGGITTTNGENGDTRDKMEHGAVKGTTLNSPKMFIGYSNDWRAGLELFGDINAIFKPKLAWSGPKPFLWNSWGVIQKDLNYGKARQVSDWIKNNLQNNSFHDEDGSVYIDLDSYWDNLQADALEYFVPYCKNNNQRAGIYWAPFADWGNDGNRSVEGSSYKYDDIYVKVNGQSQSIDGASCLDPTHPGTKDRIRYFLGRFRDLGYQFVKLDFMAHGAVEGTHYNPNCYTGIQAYNEGMAYIVEQTQGKMFLNLSIAPIFPANYAHSRRIACDAFSSMSDTKYTLNSTSYGWWLDHCYSYNDADHVVLANNASEGENRARITSAAITGIFTIGDDFSNDGSSAGKDRAKRFLTNANINEMARKTKAFRPVKSADRSDAAEMFYQKTADGTTYVAIFNYSFSSKNYTVNFSDLEISGSYDVTELWSNTKSTNSSSWSGSVNRRDCEVLKIATPCPDCPDPCSADSDGDGVNDCEDKCPATQAGAEVDASGCEIVPGEIIADFETIQVSSYTGNANIAIKEIRNNPDTKLNCTTKALYVQTNSTVGSGEAQYKSGIILQFPQFNTSDSKYGRYMHFLFKTTTEKVEFLINGNWDAKFNPRTKVSSNGWFDYVLDLGATARDVSEITILFDMRTGDNCDRSAPINDYYDNHNKYMYIDQIAVNNNSAERTAISCTALNDIQDDNNLKAFVNADKQIVVKTPSSARSDLNQISVYSICGRKITEQVVYCPETIINNRFCDGVYLVQLKQDNVVKTAKVLVY